MQNSKLIVSLAIVGIVILGIGGYAVYSKNNAESSLATVPAENTSTSSASKETLNPRTSPFVSTKTGDDEDSDQGDDDDVPVKNPVPVATPVDATKKTNYRDGTYSAVGTYNSPGGRDQLGVSVTLKNNIVVDATVTNMAGDRTSKRYQEAFISGYKSLVVGKNIDTLKLDVVSGSSLTPIGFNNAIATIKTQAKA